MDMAMSGVPVAFRQDPKKVGLMVGTQVASGKPTTEGLALPEGQQQSSLTAIAIVAVPGRFIVLPIDLLIPLVDIQANVPGEEPPPAEPEMH